MYSPLVFKVSYSYQPQVGCQLCPVMKPGSVEAMVCLRIQHALFSVMFFGNFHRKPYLLASTASIAAIFKVWGKHIMIACYFLSSCCCCLTGIFPLGCCCCNCFGPKPFSWGQQACFSTLWLSYENKPLSSITLSF